MKISESPLLKTSELPYAMLRYQAPVVFIIYKESTELGFPEVMQLVKECERLSEGKSYVTLSDVRKSITITEQGKRYVANPDNMKLFRGTAVLVPNSMFRIAANFLNSFKTQSYPFKAFTDEAKAVKWLHRLDLK